MRLRRIAAAIGVAVAAGGGEPCAQGVPGAASAPPTRPVALVDSSGNAAGRPFTEAIVLVTLGAVVAPANIRPIYGADGRTASGLATWHSGGSVLFTSADCTAGAYIHTSAHAGLRASTQVQTEAGIVLFAGAIGPSVTESIQSILYDTGCAPIVVRQNGVVPVVANVNLTTTYPPPLSFQ
jgi:hypothetical protein